MKKINNEEILTMTAAEFATLNDIEVDEVQSYSDANVGAENLSPDTELKIIVRDGEIRVTRSDNPWNEPVDVVFGPAEGWNYKKHTKKWIVFIELHNGARGVFESFDKMEDASNYAEKYWNHLTTSEKKRSKIIVGHGCVDEDGKGFAYDENGGCITDMYDVDEEGNYLEKTEYSL